MTIVPLKVVRRSSRFLRERNVSGDVLVIRAFASSGGRQIERLSHTDAPPPCRPCLEVKGERLTKQAAHQEEHTPRIGCVEGETSNFVVLYMEVLVRPIANTIFLTQCPILIGSDTGWRDSEVNMITTADLKAQTRRELADLAKNYGVPGWHGLKKDELVEEIRKVQRRLRRKANAETKKKAKSPKARKSKSFVSGKAKPTKATKASSTRKSKVASSDKVSVPKKNAKRQQSDGSIPTSDKAVPASAKNLKGVRSAKKTKTSVSSRKKAGRSKVASNSPNSSKPLPKLPEPKVSAKTARIRAQLRKRRETLQANKDLSTATLVAGAAVNRGKAKDRNQEPLQDRIVLLVRDSFWLQASWEITRASVERAQSSLAERWHTAIPVLRLLSIADVDNNSAESVERDITIHGGVDTWYLDVDEPPSRFRVLIGYLADNGDFHTLCRSNVVQTPRPGDCERLDEHWKDIAEDYERIYSLSGGNENASKDLKEVFEDRLSRQMSGRGESGQSVADASVLRQGSLHFDVDAELIVFGKTVPNANVSVAGRPVKLRDDGSFTVRMELPDKRQVLPVTAESRDGIQQRTTVIAVERNTKVMEPVELEDRF